MKSYNEIANSVFERRDKYIAMQKRKKRIIRTDNERRNEQTKPYKRSNSLLDTQIQKTQSEKIGTSQKTYKQFS